MGTTEMVELNSVEELEEIIENSSGSPQLLFKHSVSCSISREVLKIVSGIAGPVFLVVVQTARDVSNAVADKTGVRHESPQALVISGGECVFSASHYDITADALENYL